MAKSNRTTSSSSEKKAEDPINENLEKEIDISTAAPLEETEISSTPSIDEKIIADFDSINNLTTDKVTYANDEGMSIQKAHAVIMYISQAHGLPFVAALMGVFKLFLRGAANAGTPDSLTVNVPDDEGKIVKLSKFDLIIGYRQIMGDKFVRRLAQVLGPRICEFAEKHNLTGDLARKINNRVLSQGKPPLSDKEKAWCNSFMQGNPELERAAPRVLNLLAEDFTIKFKTAKGTPKEPSKGPTNTKKKKKLKAKAKKRR